MIQALFSKQYYVYQHQKPCITTVDTGLLPSSACAGWKGCGSEVEVEAVKGVQYRQPILRAVQLSSKMYATGGRRDYDVFYFIDGVRLTFKKQYVSDCVRL
jgi:hypothetical protein